MPDVTQIVDRLSAGCRVEKKDVVRLLELGETRDGEILFKAAREARTAAFGNGIFLYGFLYFSTFCRNNCCFCQYRRSNTDLPRYRKTTGQIVSAAREMAAAGVHLIDLTMGEDPEFFKADGSGFVPLVEMVRQVKSETGLPVMISPGVVPDRVLKDLAGAGAAWFACYQETHNKALYETLRKDQGFEDRREKKQSARNYGMLVEDGILTGVGETLEDLADAILWMRDHPVDQARVMTFVPQKGTPMAQMHVQDHLREAAVIAVMRLVMPDRLIPASLDVNGLAGLAARLNAGANVITSIVPPQKGLAGVANNSLDIEEARRSPVHIFPVLEELGLAPASKDQYKAWVTSRRALQSV